MKSLSLLLSIIVGIASIILFREQILDIALTTTNSLFNTTEPKSFQQQQVNHHLYATDMSVPRAIRKVFLAVEQAEGAGARVRRSIGTPQLKNFSPFLMLGECFLSTPTTCPGQEC